MPLEMKKRVKPVFDNSGFITNKDAMIKRERENLLMIIKQFAPDKLGVADPIIDSIAFQTVSCQELEKQLIIHGFTEDYKNGQNQWGKKVSSESQAYNALTKTLQSFRKQLLDIIGKVEKKEDQDELMAFLSRR